MSQSFIAAFGLLGAYLAFLSRTEAHRRWAPFVSMICQPFWLYETFIAHQWGMFALSWAYTVLYLAAIWFVWTERRAAKGTAA